MGSTIYVKDIPTDSDFHKDPERKDLGIELPKSETWLRTALYRIKRAIGLTLNNRPDYDSGYFKIESTGDTTINTYYLDHEIGSVPRRQIIYCAADRPTDELGYVRVIPPYDIYSSISAAGHNLGLTLQHRLDGDRSKIITRRGPIFFNSTEAWIRVLLWRN